MKSVQHQLHRARLQNNCPECFGTDGLEITFFQEEKENAFYSKASRKVEETLFCHKCETILYPEQWDEDIEKIYDYHKKQARPISSAYKLKPLAYLVIILDTAVLIALLYYLGLI